MSLSRLVVLISGTGSNLQAILDAASAAELPAEVVAVGSDNADAYGLARAGKADVPTFVVPPGQFRNRDEWDRELLRQVLSYEPDLVVCAGLMRILGKEFVSEFSGRIVNTHPALLPSFPGAHAVRDALGHGVKVTGVTVHFIDEGVDTGPIIAQQAVPVLPEDDEDVLHERIKGVERELLVQTLTRLLKEGWKVSGRRVDFGLPA